MDLTELPWCKSSYSMGNGGNCVEVAEAESLIHVRDSKDPDGTALSFGRAQWQLFVQAVRNGC
ncbi:DUF397 domain-containing protein [Streptomyces sp. NPDC005271]|uniref:DUF397 domain-containing protein n=1 Tax=unclassified Streptomyces TaxID=2593676 RepID=UPI0033A1D1DC